MQWSAAYLHARFQQVLFSDELAKAIPSLKWAMKTTHNVVYSKDSVFCTAVSPCPTAHRGLFAEQLNKYRQNFNSPAVSHAA